MTVAGIWGDRMQMRRDAPARPHQPSRLSQLTCRIQSPQIGYRKNRSGTVTDSANALRWSKHSRSVPLWKHPLNSIYRQIFCLCSFRICYVIDADTTHLCSKSQRCNFHQVVNPHFGDQISCIHQQPHPQGCVREPLAVSSFAING